MNLNVCNQSHCSLRLLQIMFLSRYEPSKTANRTIMVSHIKCSENRVCVTQGSRSVNRTHSPYLTMNMGKYNIKKSSLKGELKAEISNFSNIFFAMSNISEVNFVKLFSLVYCFFARKLRSKLYFSRFCDLFIVGSKTKLAACCDV